MKKILVMLIALSLINQSYCPEGREEHREDPAKAEEARKAEAKKTAEEVSRLAREAQENSDQNQIISKIDKTFTIARAIDPNNVKALFDGLEQLKTKFAGKQVIKSALDGKMKELLNAIRVKISENDSYVKQLDSAALASMLRSIPADMDPYDVYEFVHAIVKQGAQYIKELDGKALTALLRTMTSFVPKSKRLELKNAYFTILNTVSRESLIEVFENDDIVDVLKKNIESEEAPYTMDMIRVFEKIWSIAASSSKKGSSQKIAQKASIDYWNKNFARVIYDIAANRVIEKTSEQDFIFITQFLSRHVAEAVEVGQDKNDPLYGEDNPYAQCLMHARALLAKNPAEADREKILSAVKQLIVRLQDKKVVYNGQQALDIFKATLGDDVPAELKNDFVALRLDLLNYQMGPEIVEKLNDVSKIQSLIPKITNVDTLVALFKLSKSKDVATRKRLLEIATPETAAKIMQSIADTEFNYDEFNKELEMLASKATGGNIAELYKIAIDNNFGIEFIFALLKNVENRKLSLEQFINFFSDGDNYIRMDNFKTYLISKASREFLETLLASKKMIDAQEAIIDGLVRVSEAGNIKSIAAAIGQTNEYAFAKAIAKKVFEEPALIKNMPETMQNTVIDTILLEKMKPNVDPKTIESLFTIAGKCSKDVENYFIGKMNEFIKRNAQKLKYDQVNAFILQSRLIEKYNDLLKTFVDIAIEQKWAVGNLSAIFGHDKDLSAFVDILKEIKRQRQLAILGDKFSVLQGLEKLIVDERIKTDDEHVKTLTDVQIALLDQYEAADFEKMSKAEAEKLKTIIDGIETRIKSTDTEQFKVVTNILNKVNQATETKLKELWWWSWVASFMKLFGSYDYKKILTKETVQRPLRLVRQNAQLALSAQQQGVAISSDFIADESEEEKELEAIAVSKN